MGSFYFLFLLSVLLGHWGATPSWGVTSETLSSKAQQGSQLETCGTFGGSCPGDGNVTRNPTSYSSVSRHIPSRKSKVSSNENKHGHSKRASWDSDDQMDVDDDDSDDEMYDYEPEEFFDESDSWYWEAVQDGKINSDLEQDIRNPATRPQQDFSIGTKEMAFKVNNENLQPFEEVGLEPFWKKIGRFGFLTPESYMAVHGAYTPAGKIFVTTMISIADGHMVITKDRSELSGPTMLSFSNLLAGVWARAQEETEDLYGPTARLEFVSIERIDNPTTIRQMVRAREDLFRSGGKGSITQEFKVEKSSTPFADEDSRNAWLALRGILDVNTIVRMIYTHPNRFHAAVLSSIHVQFDKLNDPTSAKVFLEFEWPTDTTISHTFDWGGSTEGGLEEEEGGREQGGDQENQENITEEDTPKLGPLPPDENVLIIESAESSVANGPILHPLLPDIDRTTYKSPHRPTFKIIHSKYKATDRETNIYIVACSQQEGELAFLDFANKDYDTTANMAQTNKVLADILYAVWTHETRPDAQINGIAFGNLSPQSQDSLNRVFQQTKIKTIDDVRTVGSSHREFSKIVATFLQTREGRALRIFLQKYGDGLGNLQLNTIQYGKYTTQEGFFIYTTFISSSMNRAARIASARLTPYFYLRRMLHAGCDSYVKSLYHTAKHMQYIAEVLRGVREAEPVAYPSTKSLLENFSFEANKYRRSGRKEPLKLISPAKDHLLAFHELDPEMFPKAFWYEKGVTVHVPDRELNRDPSIFNNVAYRGINIGPKGRIEKNNGYELAAYWYHTHLVVLKIPSEGIQQNSPPLEDILFAAWVGVYGKHEADQLPPPRARYSYRRIKSGAPVSIVSFLDLTKETRALVQIIFRATKTPKSSPICLRDTTPLIFSTGSNPRNKTPLKTMEDRRKSNTARLHWLSLLATPEVKAVLRMFSKYKYQLSEAYAVDRICLRWRVEPDDDYPEIIVTTINFKLSFTSKRTKNFRELTYSEDPVARKSRFRGVKYLLLTSHLAYIGLEPQDEPAITDAEYSIQFGSHQVTEVPQLVVRSLLQLKIEFPGSRKVSLQPASKAAYFEVTASSRTKSVTFKLIVSGRNHHIIVPKALPEAELDGPASFKRMGQIFAKIWWIARPHESRMYSSDARRSWARGNMSLRVITFLQLTPESEDQAFDAVWASGGLTETPPGHMSGFILDSITVNYNGDPVILKERVRPEAFYRLFGLKEVTAISNMLENYPTMIINSRIVAFSVNGTRGNLQLNVYLGNHNTRGVYPVDFESGGTDESDESDESGESGESDGFEED
ncbi:hypothetical protein TWF706_006062 [Orbilia oligospora]|nr:hypothetical protein TWF706_006062 [Orbilia oligospora]